MTDAPKPGRKRKGTLLWTKGGWVARVPVVVDGVKIKQCFPLGTENKIVAKRKMALLIEKLDAGEQVAPKDTARVETVREAGERINNERTAQGLRNAKDEKARLRTYVLDAIGHMDVTTVKPMHINQVLDSCKAAGKSRETVAHLKNDLSTIFGALRREGTIDTNPVLDAEMPKFPKTVKKQRAVLTDEELTRYLAYQHPQKQHQGAVLERQTMTCLSRMFGGLRTGDLHALTWEASFETADGQFPFGWAPRQKTREPQKLEVPAMLRPIIRDWWERKGRPTQGPIFPTRKGERLGEAKKKSSHAHAMRRDLRRAFGVEVPAAVIRTLRRNGRPLAKQTWRTARPMTPRERELFEGTAHVLPVDFHSWRRAFSQALADANLNEQQARALTGHASLAAHARYLENATRMRSLPEAALPAIRTFQLDRMPENDTAAADTPESPLMIASGCEPFQSSGRLYTADVAGSTPVPPTPRPRTGETAVKC
jgi:site-specific recombinase XerC